MSESRIIYYLLETRKHTLLLEQIINHTHCRNETNEPLKNSDQTKTGLREKRTCSHAHIPPYFTDVKRKQNYTDKYIHVHNKYILIMFDKIPFY